MEPRIYVASLSDYNSGRLLGAWIRANQPADDIRKDIAAMLTDSTEPVAEEWAIHDTDGFGSYSVSEYEDIEKISTIASGIAEHGEAFAYWVSENDPDTFEDHYEGCYESMKDYAYELVELHVSKDTDQFLLTYFDYDQYAHELEIELFTFTDSSYNVHVFRP